MMHGPGLETMGATKSGSVTRHFIVGEGWRAYINRDGVSVSSGWHKLLESAYRDLAIRLAELL